MIFGIGFGWGCLTPKFVQPYGVVFHTWNQIPSLVLYIFHLLHISSTPYTIEPPMAPNPCLPWAGFGTSQPAQGYRMPYPPALISLPARMGYGMPYPPALISLPARTGGYASGPQNL